MIKWVKKKVTENKIVDTFRTAKSQDGSTPTIFPSLDKLLPFLSTKNICINETCGKWNKIKNWKNWKKVWFIY